MHPDENNMTSDPTPFINGLKRGADGFTNSLIVVTLVVGAAALGWLLGARFGLFPAPPVGFIVAAAFAAKVTLFFACACFVVDYTVYAVVRAVTEYLSVLVNGVPGSQGETTVSIETAVNVDPERRDTAVAYLKDFMARADNSPKGI